MLGNYSAMNDIGIIVPYIDFSYQYALFDMSGNEITGKTYKRQTLNDSMFTTGPPKGYRLTWQPTSPGEIWSIQAMLIFPYEGAEEPIGASELDSIYVLYGSIKGYRTFRVIDVKDVQDKIKKTTVPRAN